MTAEEILARHKQQQEATGESVEAQLEALKKKYDALHRAASALVEDQDGDNDSDSYFDLCEAVGGHVTHEGGRIEIVFNELPARLDDNSDVTITVTIDGKPVTAGFDWTIVEDSERR